MAQLEDTLSQAEKLTDTLGKAKTYAALVLPAMQALRDAADSLEKLTSRDLWPLPGYTDILSSI
jgi:glutamine synthetase